MSSTENSTAEQNPEDDSLAPARNNHGIIPKGYKVL